MTAGVSTASAAQAINPEHVRQLCALLDLGTPGAAAIRVYGGFHHKTWRIDTDRRRYAVKQLGVDADVRNPDTLRHYNVTEAIADAFGRAGIATIAALRGETGYLQVIGDAGYLVYPWCDGVALDRTRLDTRHALIMAGLLARMHRADIDVEGAQSRPFAACPRSQIVELVERADARRLPGHAALREQLPAFIAISEAYRAATAVLQSHLVISHGDLDQKNVLWDATDSPVVIDWESARKLNPTYELVLVALDWSGISSTFDPALFRQFIAGYQDAGGIIERPLLEASLACILGDWLIWLLYIVALSLDEADPEQRAIEAEQLDFLLPTLLRLQRLAPELSAMVAEVACQ